MYNHNGKAIILIDTSNFPSEYADRKDVKKKVQKTKKRVKYVFIIISNLND